MSITVKESRWLFTVLLGVAERGNLSLLGVRRLD